MVGINGETAAKKGGDAKTDIIGNRSCPKFFYGWDETIGFDWKKQQNNHHPTRS